MFESNLDSYEPFDNFQSLANDDKNEYSDESTSYKANVIVEECYSDGDSVEDQVRSHTSPISMGDIAFKNLSSGKKGHDLSPNS